MKIEDQIKEYFENEEIPKPDMSKCEKYRAIIESHAKKRKPTFSLWKRISVGLCCAMCAILAVVLPFVIKPNDELQFYTDDDATKKPIAETVATSYIGKHYPKYNFMFTECTFDSAIGYYIPNSTRLLGIQFHLFEEESGTTIFMFLVTSKQFSYKAQASYIDEATKTTTNNYTLYKKVNYKLESMYGYIKYRNHAVYLDFDYINEPLFDKFL